MKAIAHTFSRALSLILPWAEIAFVFSAFWIGIMKGNMMRGMPWGEAQTFYLIHVGGSGAVVIVAYVFAGVIRQADAFPARAVWAWCWLSAGFTISALVTLFAKMHALTH